MKKRIVELALNGEDLVIRGTNIQIKYQHLVIRKLAFEYIARPIEHSFPRRDITICLVRADDYGANAFLIGDNPVEKVKDSRGSAKYSVLYLKVQDNVLNRVADQALQTLSDDACKDTTIFERLW